MFIASCSESDADIHGKQQFMMKEKFEGRESLSYLIMADKHKLIDGE